MRHVESVQERRRSFGVGGAGNIRTVLEATIEDFGPDGQRRRSSVWSIASHKSTKAGSGKPGLFDGVKSIFGGGSTPKVTKEEETVYEKED